MSCHVGEATDGCCQPIRASHKSAQLILQPLRRFTYVTSHPPTLPSLHLCHSSSSNSTVVSPTPQIILQPFHLVPYVIFQLSNTSVASPTSKLILQPFRRFTQLSPSHSPTLLSLYLRHSSLSNTSVASPTS